MLIHKRKMAVGFAVAVAAASLMLPLLTMGASATTRHASSGPTLKSLPRHQTIYTSGVAYSGPVNWNPMDTGAYATGTQGLVYETLELYNPVTNGYIFWLAKDVKWNKSGTACTITLRNSIKWSNGRPLTSADVAYTIMLAKTNTAVPYSNLGPGIKSVTTPTSSEVVVTFSTPEYTQWQSFLWHDPIINKAIWSAMSPTDQVTGANVHPVGSGPMIGILRQHPRGCVQGQPQVVGARRPQPEVPLHVPR